MVYVTYATNTDGDWEALYINGTLADGVEQNHSLQIDDVVKAILDATVGDYAVEEYSFEHIEVEMEEGMAEWLGDRGFPYNLNEIPQEARTS